MNIATLFSRAEFAFLILLGVGVLGFGLKGIVKLSRRNPAAELDDDYSPRSGSPEAEFSSSKDAFFVILLWLGTFSPFLILFIRPIDLSTILSALALFLVTRLVLNFLTFYFYPKNYRLYFSKEGKKSLIQLLRTLIAIIFVSCLFTAIGLLIEGGEEVKLLLAVVFLLTFLSLGEFFEVFWALLWGPTGQCQMKGMQRGLTNSAEIIERRVTRGKKVMPYSLAYKRASVAVKGKLSFEFGGVPYSIQGDNLFFGITGAPGTGKTRFFRRSMAEILTHIRERRYNARVLIYDEKGDLMQFLDSLNLRARDQIRLLLADDARTGWWNIGREVTSEHIAGQIASTLAEAEAKRRDSTDTGDFFTKQVAGVVSLCIQGLCALRGQSWELRDLLNALRDQRIIVELARNVPEGLTMMQNYMKAHQTWGNTLQSIANFHKQLSPVAGAFYHAKRTGHPGYTVRDWVRDERKILVIGIGSKNPESSQFFNQVVLALVQSEVFQKPDRPSDDTWLFLDELPSLGYIPNIKELLSRGRSRGVCAIIGMQEFRSITAIYGEHDAGSMLGQLKNIGALKLSDEYSADRLSRYFGNYTEQMTKTAEHENGDITKSTDEKDYTLVTVHELTSLKIPENGFFEGYFYHAATTDVYKFKRSGDAFHAELNSYLKHSKVVKRKPQSEHAYLCPPWSTEEILAIFGVIKGRKIIKANLKAKRDLESRFGLHDDGGEAEENKYQYDEDKAYQQIPTQETQTSGEPNYKGIFEDVFSDIFSEINQKGVGESTDTREGHLQKPDSERPEPKSYRVTSTKKKNGIWH